MRKTILALVVALFMIGRFAIFLMAEPPQTPADEPAKASNGDAQPKPEELLRKMADYLGNLPAFSCKIESLIEIKAQGMENKMATKMTMRLQRPNRIASIVEEGIMGMTVVSDGKKLFNYLPAMKRYTVKDAPADLSELSESQETPFSMMGASMSLIPTGGDQFFKSLMSGVKSSEYIGKEKVGEVMAHRCRFVQEEMTWDIFIQDGDQPLPLKIIPDMSKQLANAGETFKDAKFDFNVSITDWNVAPEFTDKDFEFTPPADAQQVDSLFEGMAGGEEETVHPLLGEPAPTFETTDVDGHPVDLKAELGKSVILLDFWATWCGPCVQAMPKVDAVAKKFGDKGLVFHAVNVQEDAETIKAFLKDKELEVPVALDSEGTITQSYKADGIPQTVLIGKDGKVQVVHVGFSENLGELLTKEIEDLLAGKDLATEALAKAEESRKKQEEAASTQKQADEPAATDDVEKPAEDGSSGEPATDKNTAP